VTGEGYDTFLPAQHFHVSRKRPVRLIVVHCTVSPESGTGAEAVARYFAKGERRASAHCVVDSNSAVGCVHDGDTAFAAAGANADGWHLELVGYPDQSLAQWTDSFSRSMFARAAPLVKARASKWGIPLRFLSVAEVRNGAKGLCTHHDVSLAFPEVSTGHWDPGPHFPKGEFLAAVKGQEDEDVIGKDQLDDRKAAARQCFRLLNPPRNPASQAELDKVVWAIAAKGYEATVVAFMDHNGAGVLDK